jgi:hypothetical protein
LDQSQAERELDEIVLEIVDRQRPETVQQLVSYVKAGSKAQEKAIVEAVLRLQSGGKIRLAKTSAQAPKELSVYLRTEKAFWYWLILAVAILTVAIVFIVPEDFYPWVYARYVVGAIFVLWLPGYSFIRALFPGRPSLKTPEKSLDPVERVALSIGVSLALVPIIGFVLNYTPWGIRLTSETSSLLALTVTAATVAVIREHQAEIRQGHAHR